jgi:pyridoxal phosphate enzyme (YggS family)|tara:strand:+ start:6407 stop:7063 length:657 start_codon:yes stop_codon:yes gene_type:complete
LHNNLNNLISIQNTLKNKIKHTEIPKIIAVCKKFPMGDILPLINHGHEHYGENKVQEALEKWKDIKEDFDKIKLHMIGKLQTNKVKHVVSLFDYIHSLDSIRLAEKIANEQVKLSRKLKIFIQVNIGQEEQKSGIEIENLSSFYQKCIKDFDLNIIGLMCLPPNTESSKNYFLEMKNLVSKIKLKELSMGMSNDFLEASENGSTFVRIGSKIFGNRTS